MDRLRPVEAEEALRKWGYLIRMEARRADFGLPLMEFDDLVQVASLATLKAVERFDPINGTTSLFHWVRQVIRWEIAEYKRNIKPGRRKLHVEVFPAPENILEWLETERMPGPEDSDVLALQDFLRWWVHSEHPPPHHVKLVALRLSGSTLMDAGRAAGLTEGRASQIMAALEKLARRYGEESSRDS